MIIRIIGLLIVLILLYRIYMTVEKRLLRKQIEKKQSEDQSKMVQCHQCGLYVPKDEVLEKEQKLFCSSDCLDAYQGKNDKAS